jgi:hypothetical protein
LALWKNCALMNFKSKGSTPSKRTSILATQSISSFPPDQGKGFRRPRLFGANLLEVLSRLPE